MPDASTLKSLLAAGKALLQPPAPLPSAPPELLKRLRESSALLQWSDKPGWGEDDELDEVGDDEADPARRRGRRDALVLLVGQRCLDLLAAMQEYLSREFWPMEYKDGLTEKDFLLGTADNRLLRLLLQHSVQSYLLVLTAGYVAGLSSQQDLDPRYTAAVTALLGLVETPSPPSSSSTSSAPVILTTISQTIGSLHLPPIFVSAVVLAWTPSVPPATHAALRADTTRTISLISPTQAIASLSTALKLVTSGRKQPPPGRGWARRWPPYVDSALGALMSAQVMRPGGVRAVMENVFGEAGNMGAKEAVEGQKLDHIAGLLSRVPRNVDPTTYISQLLTTLFDFIAPESSAHPMVYTHTSAYVVHHLWNTSPIAVAWLKTKLHQLWLSPLPQVPGVLATPEAVVSSARTLAQLVLHSPPNPGFTDFIVGPILPPLFALHAVLAPKLEAKSIQKQVQNKDGEPTLADNVKVLLTSWGKLVDKEMGVAGLWSIIQGGRGWPSVEEHGEDGMVYFWDMTGTSAALVYGYPLAPAVATMAIDDAEETEMLDQFELRPDPPAFAALMKDIARPDISSDVFLKVLDEWRIRGVDDSDALKSLLFLRLTMAMMDALGEKLLGDADQVLNFVEGVLNDAAMAVNERTGEKKPLIQEMDVDEQDEQELPELTPEGVEKLGLVETAISLLLATLEANEKVHHSTAAILHPINAHLETLTNSPSTPIRQLAREAQLVLLVRRSASLTSDDGKVSTAIATYRRALTLVSDPILPVRAHGLVLLRDLVLGPDYDPALTPSILDVYMQAIQDKDSYIYLNAARGLAAMGDALGRDIFKTLTRHYTDTAADRGGEPLDKALRVGEALELIIKRAGKAFSANADTVVPALLALFRDSRHPTILRTSALSLLATAAEGDHMALLPWASDLASGVLDLLQLESVKSSPFKPTATQPMPEPAKPKVMLIDDDEPEPELTEPVQPAPPRTVDEDPTGTDAKHPALRRAGVVFLGLLFASLIEAETGRTAAAAAEAHNLGTGEGTFQMRLPGAAPISTSISGKGERESEWLGRGMLQRAETVLSYVAATDVDEVVRGQAGEVVALGQRLGAVMK